MIFSNLPSSESTTFFDIDEFGKLLSFAGSDMLTAKSSQLQNNRIIRK